MNPTTPSARRKAREMLLQALYQWNIAGQDVTAIEVQFYAENNMNKVDREYFREILHAIPSKVTETDASYESLLDRRLDELDPVSISILRIGAYEMASRIDVPVKVVINEAINLAKKFGPEDSQKYINAVMDRLAPRLRKAEMAALRASKRAEDEQSRAKKKPVAKTRKTAVKKAVAKRPTEKKAAAKEPTEQKAVTKKTAVKKVTTKKVAAQNPDKSAVKPKAKTPARKTSKATAKPAPKKTAKPAAKKPTKPKRASKS